LINHVVANIIRPPPLSTMMEGYYTTCQWNEGYWAKDSVDRIELRCQYQLIVWDRWSWFRMCAATNIQVMQTGGKLHHYPELRPHRVIDGESHSLVRPLPDSTQISLAVLMRQACSGKNRSGGPVHTISHSTLLVKHLCLPPSGHHVNNDTSFHRKTCESSGRVSSSLPESVGIRRTSTRTRSAIEA